MYPEWSKNLSIYEVNIRHFSKEGNFKGFRPHISRISEMGMGIVWLMPIQPIGVKNRKGDLGSPYSISNYTEVNPNFGTLTEFKELVKEIHKKGMFVLLDWVANHTAWDNVWTKTNPEFYDKDETGKFLAPCPEWEDVIHLNYSNRDLRRAMIDSMIFWLKETGIDGFRCDMAHLVPTDFWEEARAELNKIKPDIFMLAESENKELLKSAFEMIYSWKLFHLSNDIAQGRKTVKDLDIEINNEVIHFPENAYQMMFTCNHDENAWNGSAIERLGYALETISTLTFTLDGMPLVFGGQETGLYRRLSFFGKDEIEWKEDKLIPFYTKLNSLKKRNPALWNGAYGGNYQRLHNTSDENVLSFVRYKNNQAVIVLLNLSNNVQKETLSAGNFTGTYKNLFTDGMFEMESHNHFILGPWQYYVFEKVETN